MTGYTDMNNADKSLTGPLLKLIRNKEEIPFLIVLPL
jgi:hypothetical protein